MPLRNEPKTLQGSSMVVIARYFNYICYRCKNRAEMNQMIEDGSYLNYEGPFQSMPSFILTELMTVIEDEKIIRHLKRKHLHLLLLPHLETVKLSSTGDASYGMQLLMQRCKRLKRLELCYLKYISPSVLIKLIPNFPQLTYLNLKETQTIDHVMELIGKYCPEIRDLDVSVCPISDKGLIHLCYDPEKRISRCNKLVKLCIAECNITAGSIWFLLQKIPKLRELDYDNVFQVFNIAEGQGLQLETHETGQSFHLSQLTSTNRRVTATSADIAMALCPNVTNVTITNSLVENEVFYKTMTLEYLTHLRVTNDDSRTLDFNEGILPVLTVKGHQIMSLLLAKFPVVDISAIAECCPRIKNLALSSIDVYEDILYPREHYFNDLNTLEVWSELMVGTLNGIILKQLIGYSPDIHNLLVSGSQGMSDKLFQEIWRINEMKKLSRFTIVNCPDISRGSIDHILSSENEVTLIRIWSCFLINKEDNDHLQNRIDNENCDIYLDWYPWEG